MNLISGAAGFARQAHRGQTRRGGRELIVKHLFRVASMVSEIGPCNDNMVAAAYLHDTLEDTPTTYDQLLSLFGEGIANLVLELTNDPKQITAVGKATHIISKLNSMSSAARTIKLCDRLDNITDSLNSPKVFRDRYAKETREIVMGIDVPMNNTQKALVRKIEITLKKIEEMPDTSES